MELFIYSSKYTPAHNVEIEIKTKEKFRFGMDQKYQYS